MGGVNVVGRPLRSRLQLKALLQLHASVGIHVDDRHMPRRTDMRPDLPETAGRIHKPAVIPTISGMAA